MSAGAEIEVLTTRTHAATFAIDLAGNGFAQTIYGNFGHNHLIGGGGADTLIGLKGDDEYIVDSGDDVVVEAALGGLDSVVATVSYALSSTSEIEMLSTADPFSTLALNLSGNSFAQTIIGNDGNNEIAGCGGFDVFTGNLGEDRFVFQTGFGVNTITDFDAGGLGGQDLLDIRGLNVNSADFASQVSFTQSDLDAEVTIGSDCIKLFNTDILTLGMDDFLLNP
jgi:Ca2+-binding RTX toxin-like protein